MTMNQSLIVVFWTRRTIPFGWLIKLGRCLTRFNCLIRCSVPFWFVSASISIFAINVVAAAATDDDANDDVDIFRFKTRGTVPHRVVDDYVCTNTAGMSSCCLPRWSVFVFIFLFTIDDDNDDDDDNGNDDDKDGFDRFRSKTSKTIPFGWPIKRDRRILLLMALRLPLFLPEAE